jgi:hypothetical protein
MSDTPYEHFAEVWWAVVPHLSDRQLTLFSCACCRRVWTLLEDHRSRQAVEIAEQFADGNASMEDLGHAQGGAMVAAQEASAADQPIAQLAAASAAWGAGSVAAAPVALWEAEEDEAFAAETGDESPVTEEEDTNDAQTARAIASQVADDALMAAGAAAGDAAWYEAAENEELTPEVEGADVAWEEEGDTARAVRTLVETAEAAAKTSERLAQRNLLLDIAGPGKRITLPASVMHWNDGCVGKMTQTIYDERTYEQMPILADALEDAGCDNADILNHCRGPGPHVRGCWVVDLLLGKQ